MQARSKVLILSGVSGSGKTTLCRQAVALARARGWQTAGILTPGRWRDGEKIGIDVQDLRNGDRRALADRDEGAWRADGPCWHFHPDGLAWGAAILDHATPCDLLAIDELGPLELVDGGGWRNALDVLRSGSYALSLVVIRPRLLPLVPQHLPALDPAILIVSRESQDACLERIAAEMDRVPGPETRTGCYKRGASDD